MKKKIGPKQMMPETNSPFNNLTMLYLLLLAYHKHCKTLSDSNTTDHDPYKVACNAMAKAMRAVDHSMHDEYTRGAES